MNNIEQQVLEMRKQKIGYKRIATKLGIGFQKVSDILIANGMIDHIKMPSSEILNKIIKDYNSGMGIRECKSKYKMTQIASILKASGQKVRPSCFHTGYSERLNHDFFEVIDTEEKAYILGFLYADGYINEKKTCVEIGLALKDEEILHKINKALKSTKKMTYKTVTAFGGEFQAVRLTLYSKKLVEDLKTKGCYNNKTYTLSRPLDKFFSQELKRHFIRGYFDGDGCVCKSIVSFVGTDDMLEYIIEDLQANAGIKHTGRFSKAGAATQWQHNCKADIPKVFNYLYKDSNIHLERKFNKFLKIMELPS